MNTVLSDMLFPNPHDGRLAIAMLIAALTGFKDPVLLESARPISKRDNGWLPEGETPQ